MPAHGEDDMRGLTQGLFEQWRVVHIADRDARPRATSGLGAPRVRPGQSPDILPLREKSLADRGPKKAPSDDKDFLI